MSQFNLIEDMLGDSTRPVAHNKVVRSTGGSSGTRRARSTTTGNAAGGGRRNVTAMIAKKPEVMVKITGFGKHQTGIKKNMLYNSREGTLALEGEDGRKIEGTDEIKALAKQWARHSSHKRPKQRDTMNLMLSMRAGTDPAGVKAAAREFARRTFADNHDYVFVQHTDEPHPHVHFTVQMRGHDRSRLNPRKADLQQWRETFSECLHEQGIDSAATPRRARGVVLKSERGVLRHMRDKAETLRARGEKSQQIIVDRKAIDEAFGELKAGQGAGQGEAKPWESKILRAQERIRGNYLRAASILKTSSDRDEQKLAADLQTFVRDMPPLKTRRHLLKEQIAERIQDKHIPVPDHERESLDRLLERIQSPFVFSHPFGLD